MTVKQQCNLEGGDNCFPYKIFSTMGAPSNNVKFFFSADSEIILQGRPVSLVLIEKLFCKTGVQ